MKIKHTLKRYGKTISGKIKETIFEEGEERGDEKEYYSKDRKFSICSNRFPELGRDILCVWGKDKEKDDDEISYTYDTEEEAIQVMKYLREFEVKEEVMNINTKGNVGLDCKEPKSKLIVPRYVYTSSVSVENAIQAKQKRILLHDLGEEYTPRYVCCTDDKQVWGFYYIAEIPKENTLTIKQAQDKLKELTGDDYNINI